MSALSQPDISVQVSVPSAPGSTTLLVSVERRISPSWTIAQLKVKLEPVTGIPPSSQRLYVRSLSGEKAELDLGDTFVNDPRWGLRKGSELEIIDSRPPSARQNFTDVSLVPKYEMPESQYEQLTDSVLAWKRRQKLGRFDPEAKSVSEIIEERRTKDDCEIATKGIKVGERCRIGGERDGRRGAIRFAGIVTGLGGEREAGCQWIGVELDEPLGKNNGSVQIDGEDGQKIPRRLFECREMFGVLVRPEKVDVGNWPPLDDLEIDEDMEEV